MQSYSALTPKLHRSGLTGTVPVKRKIGCRRPLPGRPDSGFVSGFVFSFVFGFVFGLVSGFVFGFVSSFVILNKLVTGRTI